MPGSLVGVCLRASDSRWLSAGTHFRSADAVSGWLPRPSAWRRDALRTNLWLVPTIEVVFAVALFVVTYRIDEAAYHGEITLPSWVNNGSADAARQILIGIAAAVITVVGLVFSITIVALTLASTQFGPRILRNFVRDRGTQLTLGTFVATFVYAVLALGSISHGANGDFVPHLSITIALGLVLASLAVLIYFIHHVAKSIQLPEVIASIAGDLGAAIEAEAIMSGVNGSPEAGPSAAELERRLDESGAVVPAPTSGYLQFVAYDDLVRIAAEAGAVIRLLLPAWAFRRARAFPLRTCGRQRPPTRSSAASSAPTSPALIAPSSKTWRSRSISWSRSRSGLSPLPSTTRSRR